MLGFEQAKRKAYDILGNVDVCNEYENFFVMINNDAPEMDSSANMVAVEKETGRCCNFVSVIPKLGRMTHVYEIDDAGAAAEVPMYDDYEYYDSDDPEDFEGEDAD